MLQILQKYSRDHYSNFWRFEKWWKKTRSMNFSNISRRNRSLISCSNLKQNLVALVFQERWKRGKRREFKRLTVYKELSAKLVKHVWNWPCSDCSKSGEKKIIKSEKLMSKLKIMNPLHKLNTEMHLHGEYKLAMNLGKDKIKQEALIYWKSKINYTGNTTENSQSIF